MFRQAGYIFRPQVIIKAGTKEDEVRIFSIASGSAQSTFLAVRALRQEGFSKRVRLVLLDLDHTAPEHSLELAAKLGFPREDIITANSTTTSIEKLLEQHHFKPSIVEMAGLMDYLRDRKAIGLMRKIYRILLPNGWFFTSHIHPNMERYFLRWAFCWVIEGDITRENLGLSTQDQKYLTRNRPDMAIHGAASVDFSEANGHATESINIEGCSP